MPGLNRKGPEGKGAKTGRGLGKCSQVSPDEALNKLGKGLGLRKRSGGGTGQGRRLKAGLDQIEK